MLLSWSIFIEHLVNYTVDKLAAWHPAALMNGAAKLDAFQGSRPKHWPPHAPAGCNAAWDYL